ncbi:DUF4383 domain-containing protein [Prauserella oleivorans]|uniref:DUF4383 domain-containing protein n=1 Tax=Prauserella oleivorans TaxID=1478153 RepID=A0ABW5W8D2_9PSEU
MTEPSSTSVSRRGLTITATTARIVVAVVGVVYLVLGIVGFFTGEGMGPDASRTVWIVGISTLLNVVHTAVGVVGVVGVVTARSAATAKAYGWGLFFGFLGLTAYSVFGTLLDRLGDLANVQAGNVFLYAATALIGLGMSLVRFREDREGERTR